MYPRHPLIQGLQSADNLGIITAVPSHRVGIHDLSTAEGDTRGGHAHNKSVPPSYSDRVGKLHLCPAFLTSLQFIALQKPNTPAGTRGAREKLHRHTVSDRPGGISNNLQVHVHQCGGSQSPGNCDHLASTQVVDRDASEIGGDPHTRRSALHFGLVALKAAYACRTISGHNRNCVTDVEMTTCQRASDDRAKPGD